MGRPLEDQDRLVDPGGLHHAAVDGDIALENGQSTFSGEGMLKIADTAGGAVAVEARPASALGEGHLGGHPAGAGLEELHHLGARRAHDVPLLERLGQAIAVDGGHAGIQHSGTVELAEDGHDAAGTMDILDMVFLGIGRHLAKLRYLPRQPIDIGHVEVDLGLLSGGQQVQDGVGGAAHGDIQGHGVPERRLGADGTGQQVRLVALVIALGQLDDAVTGVLEEATTVGMGGHHGPVAR